jgi:hypothetical protein
MDSASSRTGELPELGHLAELESRVRMQHGLHVRYSEGVEHDLDEQSIDVESGLTLPGLSANPLDPQPWWTRPLADWLARQLCQYKHLRERNPDRIAWVLRGRVVARGPDDEPLLRDVEPVARLSAVLLDEAERRYETNFSAGLGPEGPEGPED